MFRIFSYLSEDPEPVADAKEQALLDETGFNREAVEGLKQLIRDKDAQLQSVEARFRQQFDEWKQQFIQKQQQQQQQIQQNPSSTSTGPTPEEYESLASSLAQEKSAHTRTIITLQQTQATLTSLQQQLDMVQKDGMHVDISSSHVVELEQEIAKLSKALEQAKIDTEQAVANATANTTTTSNDDSQEHIAHLQSQLDAQQHHITTQDEHIARLDMERQSWIQREHTYQQEMTTLRHEYEIATQTITTLQQQVATLQQTSTSTSTTEPDAQLIATLQQQQTTIAELQSQLQAKTLAEQQMHAKVSQKLDQVKLMLSRKDAHIETLKQQLIAANITPAVATPVKAPQPAAAP